MTYKKNSKRFISDNLAEFGSICWYVEGHSWNGNNKHTKDAQLRVSDCYRTITLEFDYVNYDQYLQRIAKVDNMIEELEKFKEALKDSWGKN